MKIASCIALLLCASLVLLGIGCWFLVGLFLLKLAVSILSIGAGVAFAAIIIDLWRDI